MFLAFITDIRFSPWCSFEDNPDIWFCLYLSLLQWKMLCIHAKAIGFQKSKMSLFRVLLQTMGYHMKQSRRSSRSFKWISYNANKEKQAQTKRHTSRHPAVGTVSPCFFYLTNITGKHYYKQSYTSVSITSGVQLETNHSKLSITKQNYWNQ